MTLLVLFSNDWTSTSFVCLFVYLFGLNCILGDCLPERDAAAASSLSRHPELSGCVVSQGRAPGGASRCGQDPAGPQSG